MRNHWTEIEKYLEDQKIAQELIGELRDFHMRYEVKDQIYFVNKRDDGSSDLYSLFDYKDFRDGLDAEKAYLQGRFDAIPYIDEQTDNFIK